MSNVWDAIGPLRRMLNLYGLNETESILRKIWNVLASTLCFLSMAVCLLAEFILKMAMRKEHGADFTIFLFSTMVNTALLNYSHYLLFYSKRNEFIGSIHSLKHCPASQLCFEKIRKSATTFICCVTMSCALFITLEIRQMANCFLMSYPFDRLTRFLIYCIWTATWIFFFSLMTFTPLALTFPVALATYASISINEKIADVKRTRSPLRRTRLASSLISHQEKIKEMTDGMDRFYSTHAYLLKTLVYVILSESAMLVDIFVHTSNRPKPFVYMLLPSVFAFLLYLPKAWSANRAVSLMTKCLAECELNADRNDVYVAKLRLDHLSQVVHLRMEGGGGAWSMMGEAIQGDLLYQMMIEVNDMFNLIADHHPLLPTPPRHITYHTV